MAANGEIAREGGGGRAEGEEEDVDDEATFFSLELALITGHRSSTIDGHDKEKGKEEDGNDKGIDGREVVVAAAGDAASVALGIKVVGPAARLRALVRKLLKPKAAVPILACRRGVGDGPDDDTSPPPHPPQAPAGVLLPGRKSRGEAGRKRLACKRRLLGTDRSSVSVAALPPPTPPRRDDSLLQAQDGVASAIAYCKLSLTG